jgi:predicted Ser/Thr protein kinase
LPKKKWKKVFIFALKTFQFTKMEEEWVISPREIFIHKDPKKNILGKGQFGVVTKGYWRGIPVALKQFDNIDPSKMKLMMNEFTSRLEKESKNLPNKRIKHIK